MFGTRLSRLSNRQVAVSDKVLRKPQKRSWLFRIPIARAFVPRSIALLADCWQRHHQVQAELLGAGLAAAGWDIRNDDAAALPAFEAARRCDLLPPADDPVRGTKSECPSGSPRRRGVTAPGCGAFNQKCTSRTETRTAPKPAGRRGQTQPTCSRPEQVTRI